MIAPDEMATDGRTSEEVCTVAGPPTVTEPMTNPDIVTINALVVFIAAPAVVMTIEEAVVGAQMPVKAARLLLPEVTLGVINGAKNPTG